MLLPRYSVEYIQHRRGGLGRFLFSLPTPRGRADKRNLGSFARFPLDGVANEHVDAVDELGHQTAVLCPEEVFRDGINLGGNVGVTNVALPYGGGRENGDVVGALRESMDHFKQEAWRHWHAPCNDLSKVYLEVNLEIDVQLGAVLIYQLSEG
jgi:hypothetical protein